MSKWLWIVGALGLVVAAVAVGALRLHVTVKAKNLQGFISPGKLSAAHAFLNENCSACHAPTVAVATAKCVACHANDKALLERQPTAFHADVSQCGGCHIEHQGETIRPVLMDHRLLARLGEYDARARPDSKATPRLSVEQSLRWLRGQSLDAALDCATCHKTKDRHVGLFGVECGQCHRTEQWTIEGYWHPSARSVDCAQCHQAPPSHYMEHFKMVSQRVVNEPDARVNQCYLCHQTTAWNDLKKVGWYKHH
jgi:hypothetical protein